MKKNKLTAEFFENAICKNKDMETKEYWSNIFKSNLKTFWMKWMRMTLRKLEMM